MEEHVRPPGDSRVLPGGGGQEGGAGLGLVAAADAGGAVSVLRRMVAWVLPSGNMYTII